MARFSVPFPLFFLGLLTAALVCFLGAFLTFPDVLLFDLFGLFAEAAAVTFFASAVLVLLFDFVFFLAFVLALGLAAVLVVMIFPVNRVKKKSNVVFGIFRLLAHEQAKVPCELLTGKE